MYTLKEEIAQEIKKKYKQDYLSKQIGISVSYISQILNRKVECPKRIAFCFAKLLNNDAEIEDYFIRVK